MRIAIPVTGGKLSPHFGHCEAFAMIDVDVDQKSIGGESNVASPPHQPGLLPKWLAEQGVNLVIAGGMGGRAKEIFSQHKIEVLIGAGVEEPMMLARAYLDGSLQAGDNTCDH